MSKSSVTKAKIQHQHRTKNPKERLDARMFADGLCESRQQAMRWVLAGLVSVDDQIIRQSGYQVRSHNIIKVRQPLHPWVSRGGIKLDYALSRLPWVIDGMVALDIGASTGGFCDVLLHYGARKVFAVDVGHNQMHWKIRSHPKVVVKEKLNARYLAFHHVQEYVDIVVCDVSFISATLVLPPALALVKANSSLGYAIILVKPQFEAAREWVRRGGIVTSLEGHAEACDRVDTMLQTHGWRVSAWIASSITGATGNQEYLACAERR